MVLEEALMLIYIERRNSSNMDWLSAHWVSDALHNWIKDVQSLQCGHLDSSKFRSRHKSTLTANDDRGLLCAFFLTLKDPWHKSVCDWQIVLRIICKKSTAKQFIYIADFIHKGTSMWCTKLKHKKIIQMYTIIPKMIKKIRTQRIQHKQLKAYDN